MFQKNQKRSGLSVWENRNFCASLPKAIGQHKKVIKARYFCIAAPIKGCLAVCWLFPKLALRQNRWIKILIRQWHHLPLIGFCTMNLFCMSLRILRLRWKFTLIVGFDPNIVWIIESIWLRLDISILITKIYITMYVFLHIKSKYHISFQSPTNLGHPSSLPSNFIGVRLYLILQLFFPGGRINGVQ